MLKLWKQAWRKGDDQNPAPEPGSEKDDDMGAHSIGSGIEQSSSDSPMPAHGSDEASSAVKSSGSTTAVEGSVITATKRHQSDVSSDDSSGVVAVMPPSKRRKQSMLTEEDESGIPVKYEPGIEDTLRNHLPEIVESEELRDASSPEQILDEAKCANGRSPFVVAKKYQL